MLRVRLGRLHADALTLGEALEVVAALVEAGEGGYVVTPNVDHVVLAERNARLRAAYAGASLSLVDGTPLLWLSALLRYPLPEKVSGADLVEPLMARAAIEGWRVYLLGARPGVGLVARARLIAQHPGLQVVGVDAPAQGFERNPRELGAVLARLRAAHPHLVLFALGCPKQELLMHAWREAMAPAVGLGIGAALDFVAGTVRRAPRWVSRVGLEWAYRLAQEPRRLAHRYLVRDRAIVGITWRMVRTPAAERGLEVPMPGLSAPVVIPDAAALEDLAELPAAAAGAEGALQTHPERGEVLAHGLGPAAVGDRARRTRVMDAANEDVLPGEGDAGALLGEGANTDQEPRPEVADDADEGAVAGGK